VLASPTKLHIPDGFLTPLVAVIGWALALAFIVLAVRRTRSQLGERQVPMMGILAAFIFAAQAINFPVAGGSSGHLVGGALAAVVMGPWAATLIMTAVIAVQGLLFQDGGLLVMGWNILNMGVFAAFTGYAAYALVLRLVRESRSGRLAGIFAAGWVSVEVGAIATALELGISGTTPPGLAVPAMAGVHALIGLGEGLISLGAMGFLAAARPELLETGELAPGRRGAIAVAAGVVVALVLAALSPLASQRPDGLESVAEQQGFVQNALPSAFGVLPDYALPFITDPALATIAAVALGTVVVFIAAWMAGRAAARRSGT
jgi:cobalt/nickel transport system permease protein